MTVHGIILAAGESSRMGTPKALLTYQGRTFVDRLVEAFRAACDSVSVVTSPRTALPGAIVNPAPERGMLSSLQCGLAGCEADAYLFTPVDYPAVRPETIAAIVAAFRSEPTAVIIPVFRDRHGHPVCISRRVAQEILALPNTATARDAMHRYEPVYIAVNDPGIVQDVDTPVDYLLLQFDHHAAAQAQ